MTGRTSRPASINFAFTTAGRFPSGSPDGSLDGAGLGAVGTGGVAVATGPEAVSMGVASGVLAASATGVTGSGGATGVW